MTIEGAIAELQNLIKADDVPFYYNGAIQKVIETIIDERPVRCGECKWQKVNKKNGFYGCGHRFGLVKADDDSFCPYGERKGE